MIYKDGFYIFKKITKKIFFILKKALPLQSSYTITIINFFLNSTHKSLLNLMKKFILFFALLIASMTLSVGSVQAASITLPTATTTATTTVEPQKVVAKLKKAARDGDNQTLAIIFAILFPCLGVYFKEQSIGTHFWIALLLQCLFWIPGIIYALIIVLK